MTITIVSSSMISITIIPTYAKTPNYSKNEAFFSNLYSDYVDRNIDFSMMLAANIVDGCCSHSDLHNVCEDDNHLDHDIDCVMMGNVDVARDSANGDDDHDRGHD